MTLVDWFFDLRSNIADLLRDGNGLTLESAEDLAEGVMSFLNAKGLLNHPATFDDRSDDQPDNG